MREIYIHLLRLNLTILLFILYAKAIRPHFLSLIIKTVVFFFFFFFVFFFVFYQTVDDAGNEEEGVVCNAW